MKNESIIKLPICYQNSIKKQTFLRTQEFYKVHIQEKQKHTREGKKVMEEKGKSLNGIFYAYCT